MLKLEPAASMGLPKYLLSYVTIGKSEFGFCNHRFAVTERNIKLWVERQIWKIVCFAK